MSILLYLDDNDADGEWDGDEYNGPRFFNFKEIADDTTPEPAVSLPIIGDENDSDTCIVNEKVKVWIARSQPRDQETGAIAFDISFEYANWKMHRVSIIDLMDLEDNSFPYDEVTQAINNWIDVAKRFPHTRRNCLSCNKRATKGKVLCGACHMRFGKVIYAE